MAEQKKNKEQENRTHKNNKVSENRTGNKSGNKIGSKTVSKAGNATENKKENKTGNKTGNKIGNKTGNKTGSKSGYKKGNVAKDRNNYKNKKNTDSRTAGKNSTDKKAGKKNNRQQVSAFPSEWLFLSKSEVASVSLKDVLKQIEGAQVEYWEIAEVIEAEFDDETSMDFEKMEIAHADAFSREYCEKNGIQTAYIVTVRTQEEVKIREIMKLVSGKVEGFFVVDDGTFAQA